MGTIVKMSIGGTTHLVGSSLYGTSDTAAGTATKVVTCSNFDTLTTGVTIHVKFTYSNTASNPTLNVNSTGAKSIYRYGTTAPGTTATTSWYAGAVVSFTYDGSYWQMNDYKYDTNTTYSSLKNPNALTISLNGTSQGAYDGSSAKSVNITPSSIGAYTKTEVDNKVASVYKYKGSVATADLPTSGQTTGDVYNLTDASTYGAAGMNVAWNGSAWDALGSNVSISNATTSAAGLMSSSDKSKLDGITASADSVSYTASATSGNKIGTITINGTATDMYSPTQTSVSGNAGTATKLATARTITLAGDTSGSVSFDGSANVTLTETNNSLAYRGTHTEVASYSSSYTTTSAASGGMLDTSQGMYLTGTYNDSNTPTNYGNIINVLGSGSGQLLLGWSGSDNTTEKIYYRSHRDTSTGGWGPWKTVAYTDSTVSNATNATTATKLGSSTVGGTYQPVYLNSGTATAGTSYAKAIKSITRSDTTFTYTTIDGSTGTFTQQDNNTTYSAGTGLSLSGTTINHASSVTAGTAGTSSATSGATLAVPYVTYNATGHITGAGTHTHTISGFLPTSGGTVTGKTYFNQGHSTYTLANGSGTSGYMNACTIKVTETYQNQPMIFTVTQRGYQHGHIYLAFTSANSTDPALGHFTVDGKISAYIVKADTSTWTLYIKKTGSYDNIEITDLQKGAYNTCTITWNNTTVTSLPDGYTTASQETTVSTTSVGSASSWSAGSAPSLTTTTYTVPNVTAVGSAPSLTTTTYTVPNITDVGSTPTLGTAISADDITAWSAGSASSTSYSAGVLTLTNSTVPSLSYTARSIPNVTSVGSTPTLGTAFSIKGVNAWSAGSVPTLGTAFSIKGVNAWSAGSVPSLTVTSTSVVKSVSTS